MLMECIKSQRENVYSEQQYLKKFFYLFYKKRANSGRRKIGEIFLEFLFVFCCPCVSSLYENIYELLKPNGFINRVVGHTY